MVQLSDIVQARADILTSEINGELVMMDMENGQYYTLDAIGCTVWRALTTPCQVAELCRQLGEQYDAPAAIIEKDMVELLERMLAKRMIALQT